MFNTEDEILRRLQEKNLEMAVMFYHWCQRNHLTCYLCGGGCIGAIRHGGFIPWDDDLDFFMPRKDYEKFLKIWDTQEESKNLQARVPERGLLQCAHVCEHPRQPHHAGEKGAGRYGSLPRRCA